MKTRSEIVAMVKAWSSVTSRVDEFDAIDRALFERDKTFRERPAGKLEGLLMWAVSGVASAVRDYQEACAEDQRSKEIVGATLPHEPLTPDVARFAAQRMGRAAVALEQIPPAQAMLSRVLEAYEALAIEVA